MNTTRILRRLASAGMMNFLVFLLTATTLIVGAGSVIGAPFQSDDFGGTSFNGTKWELPPVTYDNGALTQNNALYYHNNNVGMANDEGELYSLGVGSVTNDWSVWMDVLLPDLPQVNTTGQNVHLTLKVWNAANLSERFDIEPGLHQNPVYGKVRDCSPDFTTDDWITDDPRTVILDVAENPRVSVAVSWQASTKTFSAFYDANGGGNDWIFIKSWSLAPGSPTEWHLDPASGFGIYIGGRSNSEPPVNLRTNDNVKILRFVAAEAALAPPIDVLYLDNFQDPRGSPNLTSTNYVPTSGPPTATAKTQVESGLPSMTRSNFLGSLRLFFNETSVPCMSEYYSYLSAPQTNQVLDVTWQLYIDAVKAATSTGGFGILLPVTNMVNQTLNDENLVIHFADGGQILVATNAPSLSSAVVIGSWSNLVGTIMTNELVLNYPARTLSFSLNGTVLINMPMRPDLTNLVDRIDFEAEEAIGGTSAGNKFALDEVKVSVVSVPPRITAIQRSSADIRLNVGAVPGGLYTVQRRDDLTSGSWTTLTNNIVGTGGTVSVTDSGATTNVSKRFYRVVLPP